MLAGRFRFFLKSSSTALSSLSSTTTTTTVSPISSSRQLLSLHQRTLATASNTKHSETASHGHDHHEHHDDHHDDHHHEHGKQPGGYLFNMKPGDKYVLEGWEIPFYVGIWGSFVVAGYCLISMPSIGADEWAKKEAEKRLAAKGF